MRNPRSTGSAHAGLMEWLLQRVSSLYMAGFVLYVAAHFSLSSLHDYLSWKAWFASGFVRLAWALFFLNLFVHTWIGLRSIYMDYLHPLWLRFTFLLLTAFGLLTLGLWAAQILFGAATQ